MSLLVSQEGHGKILLTTEVPLRLQKYIIPRTNPLVITGNKFDCLMQEFPARDVSGWDNRMLVGERCVINLEAPWSAMELRIALKNRIRGTWDGKTDGDVPPGYFQFNYVPRIATRAIFEKAGEFRTYDVHYKLPFLENAGIRYPLLDRFIENVRRGTEPVEMLPLALPCSDEMLQLVNIILRSEHSDVGYERMMENHLHSLLIAALEIASRPDGFKLYLTQADKEALHDVRDIIVASFPVYLSNAELLQKVYPQLDGYKLHYGFNKFFYTSPFGLYQRLCFDKAKQLLEKGDKVNDIAYFLQYSSPDTFIRQFRRRFGVTPKQWAKG
jgi:hypothetical protein